MGCIQYLAVTNKAGMNNCGQVFGPIISFLLSIYLGVKYFGVIWGNVNTEKIIGNYY